ncbi:hypothetical protein HNQ07_000382 [Deinococcus metalli]|uniref:DUF2927 domain-containing protein n=1 Tax=Deinococcus metalli TaxID=1141878 RepID=A0A7W8KBY4_9DEIO|nr:hypothetical protein [Deinococcus metalli]MBB5374938.1 hypothetical protein [Deinococcus metalli]GHF32591.1 hypothetical protein GCM10017781_06610 [Deinococcus metalli]
MPRHRWAALALALSVSAHAAPVTVAHGTLTVTYRDARDRAQLPLVFRTWEAAASDLTALGLTVRPVRIDVAADAPDFTRRTGEPASIAASTRGQTIVTQRLSALATRGILAGTIRHEGFHTAQPPGLARWLAEGLARIFSGEAAGDPVEPTGLTALSGAQLDARLLGRAPGEAGAAYREATRRARALVARVGWKGALAAR